MRGMVFTIDLASCTGCYTCRIACHDRAGTPDSVEWLRVEEHEAGVYPHPTLTYRPIHCFHCDAPICITVCPVKAISQGDEGWIIIDPGLCTGCGACRDACPFDALVIGTDGIATGCDGCRDEVGLGWDPTCVRACPLRALEYVPVPDSIRSGREHDPQFDDHGIGPRVVYLRRNT
ncbi:MAG: 4Fe-4S dicluster domain-containing protein [Chloroflexi bacterium]|nr:4Fe-4S dicluster domain-containing protein [Chloroflexota bacterium]